MTRLILWVHPPVPPRSYPISLSFPLQLCFWCLFLFHYLMIHLQNHFMFKPTCEALRRKPHRASASSLLRFTSHACCLEYEPMITGTRAVFFLVLPSPLFISLVLDLTASSSCLTYFHSSTPPPFPPCPLPLPSLTLSLFLAPSSNRLLISMSSFQPTPGVPGVIVQIIIY